MARRVFGITFSRTAVLATAAALLTAVGGVAAASPQMGDSSQDSEKSSVKTMTWNVCANSKPKSPDSSHARCVNGRQTDKLADGISRHMKKRSDLRVVMLQEICSVDVEQMRQLDSLKGWHFKFSAIRDKGEGDKPNKKLRERHCNTDLKTGKPRGELGVALGVKSHTDFRVENFPDAHSPEGRDRWGNWGARQTVVCGDVKEWDLTACGTHLTPLNDATPDERNEFWKAQAAQMTDLRKYAESGDGKHVVFGGDLNQPAPDTDAGYGDKSTAAPLYESHLECEQSEHGDKRNGRGTFQWDNGNPGHKIDYLFANKDANASCYVPETHVSFADHLPVIGDFTYAT